MTTIEDLILDFNEMQEKAVNQLNKVAEINDSTDIEVESKLNDLYEQISRIKKANKLKIETMKIGLTELLKLKLPKSEKEKLREIIKSLDKLKKKL